MNAQERQLVLVRLARRLLEGASVEETRTEIEGLPAELQDLGESLVQVVVNAESESAPPSDEFTQECFALVRAATRSKQRVKRYQTMMEHSFDGVFVVGPDGRYIEVNPRGCEMLGYSEEELRTKRIYDLVDPQDPPPVLERVQRQHPLLSRRRLRRKDGSTFVAEIGARRLPNEDVFAIVRDVTAQVAAEQELRESSERFGQALRAARAGAWEWCPATNESFWSEDTYWLLGYDPSQVQAETELWFEAIHPEDRAEARNLIEQAIQNRSDLDLEVRLLLPDGSVRWVRSVAHMSIDSNDELRSVYGIMFDVTQSKKSELAHEQTRARLQQAQRMEAIGRLAGGIAHDFNNLLTIILSSAHLAAEYMPTTDPNCELIEAINVAGSRGAALTRQLLALSRQQPAETRSVILDDHVKRMAPMLRRLLGEEIHIRMALRAGQAGISIDPAQLDQILLNLAINGRDAMSRGGTLTFSTSLGGTKEPLVILSVRDTGVGMDEETRNRIFEPFFTTKGAASGTGLGLATVYGIVMQNGACIEVESAPGSGSEFRISFPATQVQGDVAKISLAPAVSHTGFVLVVEDERAVRTLVRRVLEGAGYEVLEARDGLEAIKLASEHQGRIDLLLTDVVLPALSGPEIAERLRADRPDLSVLFISGYLGDVLSSRGLPPDSALLEKPFTPTALLAAVRRSVRASQPKPD